MGLFFMADNKKEKTTTDSQDNLLAKLTTRLSVAKKAEREQRKWWKQVLKVLDFKREVTIGGDTNTQKIKYPLVWAAYDNYISELSFTPPQTIIEAEAKEDLVKKVFWKGVLEYAKRKDLKLVDLKEQFIQSFIITGKAIYKIGRHIENQKGVKKVKGEDGKTIVKQDIEGIVENKTFVEVIDPRRFYMSPETKYRGPVLGEECPYVIEEMVKTKEHIENEYNIKIDDDELELIDPDFGLDKEDKDIDSSPSLPGENTDDLKRVRLFAYHGVWEGKSNMQVLFTYKKIVQTKENQYKWGNKKPYVVALNFKNFFKPTARGSLDSVLDLDQEFNEHMNKRRTYIRRMVNPKWAKLKGTQVDETALLDPDVGIIVDESEPNSFRPVLPPTLDSSIFKQSEDVEQLFYLLTGIIYGQTSLSKAGTATGQGIMEKGKDVKSGRMTTKLERAQEELEMMILQLEQQYAPLDGTDIRITGSDVVEMIRNKKFLHQTAVQLWEQNGQEGQPPVDEYEKFSLSEDGKSIYTNYTRDDIEGEFELTIISQSSNRSNRNIQAQQILNALKLASPDSGVNSPELWKRLFVLWEMNDIDNLVNKDSTQQQQAGGQPAGNVRQPTEGALQGPIQAQANRTV